ncbi:MAG: peroxiredoxin [Myxococcaceae bacterium]|nr:peroxiredoxin [Myxococcaceae bacterium]
MALPVGTQAPDFTLPSKPGETLTLSSLRGKNVVLLFFPAAFTSVCTKEMCTIAEDYSAYESLNAQPIAISVDTPWVLQKFAAESKATFPFVSDFNKTTTRDYDVYRENFAFGMKGVSERAVFVIGPDGVIKYSWVGENPGVFPDLDAVKQALA